MLNDRSCIYYAYGLAASPTIRTSSGIIQPSAQHHTNASCKPQSSRSMIPAGLGSEFVRRWEFASQNLRWGKTRYGLELSLAILDEPQHGRNFLVSPWDPGKEQQLLLHASSFRSISGCMYVRALNSAGCHPSLLPDFIG